MSRLLAVVIKELTDILRDRRTAFTIFALSIAVGPMVLYFLGKWVSAQEAKVERRVVSVMNIAAAPSFANFLARQDVTVKPVVGDAAEQVKAAKLDAVIIIPNDFEAGLATGEAPSVELVFDSTRTGAQSTIGATREYLRAFIRETGNLRLLQRGVSPDVLAAVKIENNDQSTERRRGAAMLLFLQISMLMAGIVGGMAAATDVTAGERERGSLEPLMMNPVSPAAIVTGKFGAVFIYSAIVVLLTMVGYFVALKYLPAALSALKFGGTEFWRFTAIILPFTALMVAAQLLIAVAAKSYKEAQTYLSYLSVVVSFLPTLGFFLDWQDQPWQLAVPVLGQNAAMIKVLGGDAIRVTDYLLPGGVALALTALCLALLTALIQREKIIFAR
jgi:sodium transport system permease protein